MFIWVALKENVRLARLFGDNYSSMLESRISAGAEEKSPGTKATGKPDAETITSWSYDLEGHAKKCVERYCERASYTTVTITQSRNAMHG